MQTAANTASVVGARTLIQWGPVIGGALAAAAMAFILLMFASAVGLSVMSASPTWRDTSAALALLSGLFLILQALFSFALGGYLAGRTRIPTAADATSDTERMDGVHGMLSWALAILLGAVLMALISSLPIGKAASPTSQFGAAEPLLSYEIDRLLRSPRRPANADLNATRAEIGRILMTTSSHTGVTNDDRAYLVQEVANLTGSGADATRRVDDALGNAKTAIQRARRTAVILSFSASAALLIGAVVAWASAAAGGRHRDGEPLPRWMRHGDRWTMRRGTSAAPGERISQTPDPFPS